MVKLATKRARKGDDHHEQVARRPKFLYRERCIAGLYNACLDEEKRFRKKRVSLATVRSRIKKVAEEYNDKLGPNSTKFINKNVEDLTKQGFFEKPDAGYIQFSPQAAKIIHTRSSSPKSVFQQDSPHPKALMRAFEQAGLRPKRRRLITDDEEEDEVQQELGLQRTNEELEEQLRSLRAEFGELEQRYHSLLNAPRQREPAAVNEDEDGHEVDGVGEVEDVFTSTPANNGGMDFDIQNDGYESDNDADDHEREPPTRLSSPDHAEDAFPSSSPVQPALVRRPSKRSLLQPTQTEASQDVSSISLFPIAGPSSRPGQPLATQRSFTGYNSGRITPAPSAGQRSPLAADQHDVDIEREASTNEQLAQLREELETEKEDARQLREVVRLLRLEKEREAETRAELSSRLDGMVNQKALDDLALVHLREASQQAHTELRVALIAKDAISLDLEASRLQLIEKDSAILTLQQAEQVNQETINEYKHLLQGQQTELQNLRTQFDAAKEEVQAQVTSSSQRFQVTLAQVTSRAELLDKRILQREDDIRLLQNRIVELKALGDVQAAANSGLVTERDTLRGQLNCAQKLIDTSSAELASLNTLLTTLEKEKFILSRQVEVVKDAQLDLEDKLEGASDRIFALDKQITGHVRDVEDLRLALIDERDRLGELERHVSVKDVEIDQQAKKVKEHQFNIHTLERRVVELYAAFKESQNENETLEQRLEEVTLARDEIVRALTKMPGRDSPVRVSRSARASLAKSLAGDNDQEMLA